MSKNKLNHLDFSKPPELPELEKEVLEFWKKDKTFEKSVEQRDPDDSYVFYDGPPFATGMPHYGHLLASTTKDVVPRYQTMRGKRVERVWGWDCHGLPLENLLEKELDLKNKQAIEDYGVANFNEACRNRVLTYANDWKEVIATIGRWVDMDHAYHTMDKNYMESLWWVFKALYDRGLIYQGHKPMHICPRCSTPLSNFEVTQGYKDVTDIAVTVEVKLKDSKTLDPQRLVDVLIWTTTPWTLPGNLLLAVNANADYLLVTSENPKKAHIVAKDRVEQVFAGYEYEIIKELKGHDLVGLEYQPIFPYYAKTKNAFRIAVADFVQMDEGTGIVHIAPGFGEDDFALGQREAIELIQHVGMDGKFKPEVTDFAGLEVKPKDNPLQTDIEILKWLQENDLLFKKEKVKHSYPHCWRCDTPLLNYATESWYVKVTEFKNELLENNQKINWVPDHIKNGRFGDWLENARDWAISRNRYWGTPLPVWQSEDGERICVGSAQELEELSGQKVTDLHKHIIDEIVIKKDGKEFKRITEVLDCWFESGAMPYASVHYPFENKENFEKNFPAEFISEGQDQTRGWFYTLHVLATALSYGQNPAINVSKTTSAFKNCVVSGIVLAEDGKKMSKRLKNYPDPMEIVRKYGADSLRLYLMSSSVIKAENLNFSEKDVADIRRRVFVIWWNMLSFYKQFADQEVGVTEPDFEPNDVMDKWLLSRVSQLIEDTQKHMDSYDLVKASRGLMGFVDELSTWYLRLSRERFRQGNAQSSQIFGFSLLTLAKLMAPFAPFFAEVVNQSLTNNERSIHLSKWPVQNAGLRMKDEELDEEMNILKDIVEMGRKERSIIGFNLRQPLAKLEIFSRLATENGRKFEEILRSELNVKEIIWDKGANISLAYDQTLTPTLKAEGEAREMIREIMNLRKAAGLGIDDEVKVQLKDWPKEFESEIMEKTKTIQIVKGEFNALI